MLAYQSIKIETYSGENVTVLSKDKLPVFFEIADQERLLPTVYSLWQAPELVPYFTTFPPVLLKLANGADLMVPGIIREGSDLRAFGRYKKDEICAVNLTSNKSAVGVGLVARSSEDMYMSGGHGIGVKMLHVFGDNLWGIEPTVIQQVPLSGPTKSIPTLTNDSDFPALGSEPPKKEEVAEKLANLEINNDQETEGNQEESENLDDVLKGIFLGSLKSNKKQLSSQLPLLVSTFYPNYVQKEMQADRSVNIKETSFKKVSTFIKKMSESGYITLKEETKGIEKIVAVNFDHPDIINFAMKKKEKSANDSSVQEGPQLLLTKMTELYVVNEPTKALFNCLAVPVGKSLDSTQVKNYIKDYVCRNKLFDNTTKHVTLDENLKVIVGAITQASTVSLENLNDIVLDRMDNTFEMRSQSKPQAKGGKKPIITITTATRSGNKKVILILKKILVAY